MVKIIMVLMKILMIMMVMRWMVIVEGDNEMVLKMVMLLLVSS